MLNGNFGICPVCPISRWIHRYASWTTLRCATRSAASAYLPVLHQQLWRPFTSEIPSACSVAGLSDLTFILPDSSKGLLGCPRSRMNSGRARSWQISSAASSATNRGRCGQWMIGARHECTECKLRSSRMCIDSDGHLLRTNFGKNFRTNITGRNYLEWKTVNIRTPLLRTKTNTLRTKTNPIM